MHTILSKEIDGYSIIAGFGQLSIDPEATRAAVNGKMEDTDEYSAVVAKQKEIQPILTAYQDAKKAAKEAAKNKNESLAQQHMYRSGQLLGQLDNLQSQMADLKQLYRTKSQEIWNENLVYFEPKKGEISITYDEYYQLNNVIAGLNNAVLAVDKTEISDHRGVKYIKNGAVVTIDKLGVEPDGPLQADVTPEEFEQMRLDAMTEAEKQTELANVIEGLASRAAAMRAMLEIQDVSNALQQAQKWYNDEVKKAEKKYGVTA